MVTGIVVSSVLAGGVLYGGKADAAPNTGASFGNLCKYSHSSFADPVMHPEYKNEMLHDFYGNLDTNRDSTGSSLRGGETMCGRPENASAYWHPRLRWNNHHLIAGQPTAIYYKAGHHDGNGHRVVEPFPKNFKMLVGGKRAFGPILWKCKGTTEKRTFTPPKRCHATQGRNEPILEVSVRTPECWSGNRSKISYHMWDKSGNRAFCPDHHPVQVPELVAFFNLTIPKEANSANRDGKVTVHMGREKGWHGPEMMHMDFMNGWDQAHLERLVKTCIRQVPKSEERPKHCRDPRQFTN